MARRKHREEEHVSQDRWLVSYADFITLLFAFFTVLYATSQQDTEKQKQFEQSLRKYFGAMIGGASSTGDTNVYEQSRNYIEPAIRSFPDHTHGNLEVEDFVDKYLKKNLTPEEYNEVVREVASDTDGVRIRLSANFLFIENEAVVSSKALAVLQKLGSLLKQTSHQVVIEGHTDNTPLKESHFASNWELSSMRATKVVRFFIERSGLPPSQFSARAFADQKPLGDNATEEGRTTNRRIDVLISNQTNED